MPAFNRQLCISAGAEESAGMLCKRFDNEGFLLCALLVQEACKRTFAALMYKWQDAYCLAIRCIMLVGVLCNGRLSLLPVSHAAGLTWPA
jgi:hypothetical protein